MGFINALSPYLSFPDLLCCFPLQSIQNLNFDPPTTCQTVDSKPRAIGCSFLSVWVYTAEASKFMSVSVLLIKNNYLMGLWCLDLIFCV